MEQNNSFRKNSFQIAGKHFDTYEAYYRGLDPKTTNVIAAMDAAKFLKKSGLSDVVLSRVSTIFFYGRSRCVISSISQDQIMNDLASLSLCSIVLGVGFVGSTGTRMLGQARILHCFETRFAGPNG